MPELEIYSAFNCTWCYFDKPSVKKLEQKYEINIRYRAFPLHIDVPEGGLPIKELFCNNLMLMADKMTTLEKKAESLGLPLAKRSTISDSRRSQELAKWAESKGKEKTFQDAVFKAYFADGLNIADPEILTEIAGSCGLPKKEALKIIETGAYSNAVDDDWETSEEEGIMVAPTYIINGTRLLGSQSYDTLEALMTENSIPRKSGG